MTSGRPPRIVVTGDSNVFSIYGWWEAVRRDFDPTRVSVAVQCFSEPIGPSLDFTFVSHTGEVRMHPIAQTEFETLGIPVSKPPPAQDERTADWVLLQLGSRICYHRLFYRWGNLDFVSPDPFGKDLPLEGQLVPHEIVLKRVNEDLVPLFRGLEILHRALGDRLVFLPPPPPHRENARLEETIMRVMNEHHTAPRPSARLKVQRVYHAALQAFCDAQRIHFHDTWNLTCAPDGFLDTRFEYDGFHAHPSCGALILMSFYDWYVHPSGILPRTGINPWPDAEGERALARTMFGS